MATLNVTAPTVFIGQTLTNIDRISFQPGADIAFATFSSAQFGPA